MFYEGGEYTHLSSVTLAGVVQVGEDVTQQLGIQVVDANIFWLLTLTVGPHTGTLGLDVPVRLEGDITLSALH